MIQDNIDNLPDIEESIDKELFSRKMSIFIKEMIEQYKQSIINTTSKVNMEWINKIKKKHKDHLDLLPISIFLIQPQKNTIHF